MSSGDYDYYYLCDGVYWNWDRDNTDEIDDEFLEAKHEKEVDKIIKQEYKVKYILDRIFSSTNNPLTIKTKIYRALLNDSILNSMIERYCYKEDLPEAFAQIALQNESIKHLISYAAKEIFHYSLTGYDYISIKSIQSESFTNINNRIAYDRVSKIRQYVISNFQHKDTTIDRHKMKNFLSACRLAINISDLLKMDINKISQQISFNKLQHSIIVEEPNIISQVGDYKYFSRWKAQHMHTLFFYAPKETRLLLQKIIDIESEDQEILYQEIQQIIDDHFHIFSDFDDLYPQNDYIKKSFRIGKVAIIHF